MDDLTKKLDSIQGNLELIESESRFLADDFKDLEKMNDVAALKKALEEAQKEQAKYSKERDDFRKELDKLEGEVEKKDPVDTTSKEWDDVIGRVNKLDEAILKTLGVVNGVDAKVAAKKGDAANLTKKYKKKRETFGACQTERKDVGKSLDAMLLIAKQRI